MPSAEYQKSFVLTVSESKRLIAKGVARCPEVLEARKSGIVAVAKGTTNGYIVEELTGRSIRKSDYCTSVTTPKGVSAGTTGELPDLVLRGGERWEGVAATEAVAEMKAGDVFIKGANAINYDLGQVGIIVGHPAGGTIGAAIGSVVGRRATLLTPAGLEKNVPGDLHATYARLTGVGANGSGPTLWPVPGTIFTEIEALEVLCSVEAQPIAAGGIAGAEGGVWLSVWGTKEQVDSVEALLGSIQGEPPFIPHQGRT